MDKVKIIYVMDPICGWCYGNIENTKALFNDFKDKVEFEVLPGGMWSGDNKRIQSEQMMNYFLKHDKTITQTTGVEYGQGYIDFITNRQDVVLDSEIPSSAIVTISKIAPELILPFAMEILKARYFYGKDFNDDQTYEDILATLNIDSKLFFEHFKSEEIKPATQEVFKKAASYARSYPTLLAEKNGQVYMLEQGYLPYNDLKANVQSILEK
jgi:putative protein-disulfide isomerase